MDLLTSIPEPSSVPTAPAVRPNSAKSSGDRSVSTPSAQSKPQKSFAKELESNDLSKKENSSPRLSKPSDNDKETLASQLDLPEVNTVTPPPIQPNLADVPLTIGALSGGALGTNQEATTQLKNHPVVSLLTGHLEKLVPQQIPNIVSESKFLNAALSSDNISEYLDTKQPLEKLMDLFGLDSSVVEGQVSQDMVSPRELLKKAGIDPSRVAVEMGLLKDNLPLSGLTTYMIRAAKLRGAHNITNQNIPKAGPPIDSVETSSSDAVIKTDSKVPVLSDAPTEKFKGDVVVPSGRIPVEDNLLGVKSPGEMKVIPTKEADISLARPESSQEIVRSNESLRVRSDLNLRPDFESQKSLGLLSGLNLNTSENDAVQITDVMPAMNIENIRDDAAPPDLLSNNNQENMFLGKNLGANLASNVKQAKPLDTATNLERMIAAQIEFQEPISDSNLGGKGGNQSQADQGFLGNNKVNPELSWNQSVVGNGEKFEITEPTLASSTDSFVPVKNEIVKHSQMLLQNGGGTVKLNLDTKELGAVEISLDVQNDTVGMKLLVASDQAKEMLVQDMSKLRDALNSHNLDLKNVEFMYSNKNNEFQGSFADQGNPDADQFLNQPENGVLSNLRTLSDGMSSQFKSMKNSYVPYRVHNGSIQVVA